MSDLVQRLRDDIFKLCDDLPTWAIVFGAKNTTFTGKYADVAQDIKEAADLIERLYREGEAKGDALREALKALDALAAGGHRYAKKKAVKVRATIEKLEEK